jgi:hypothetical protein
MWDDFKRYAKKKNWVMSENVKFVLFKMIIVSETCNVGMLYSYTIKT